MSQYVFRKSMPETTVIGAALGTGTALLIAVTIIMFKYYRLKQQSKEWHSLDQLPFPPGVANKTRPFYPLPRTVSLIKYCYRNNFTYQYHCNK